MSECLAKVLTLLEKGLPKITDSCETCIEAAKGAGAL